MYWSMYQYNMSTHPRRLSAATGTTQSAERRESSTRVGVAFAGCCLVLLGVMPILAGTRPQRFDSLAFAAWLTIWQLVCAVPAYVVERLRTPLTVPAARKSAATTLILVTGLMFGSATYMYVVAAEKAGPVNMGIALQAYPLFAMLLEALFLRRRQPNTALGFTLLMIAGLVYLTTGGTFRLGEISGWSLFALGIPMLWSIAHVLLRQHLAARSVTPSQVTVTRLVISGAFLLILHVTLGSSTSLPAELTDAHFQTSAAIMGAVYYLELIFWFHAMRHIDVSIASAVTVPAPAVTMLVSATLLGKQIHAFQMLALAVITLGMYGLLYPKLRVSGTPPSRIG
jgi:drug/metabolite transporter (DMT)-like permease